MAFTVTCTPLYPGGRPQATRAKSPEVDLLQDRKANYQEFVDLMRQVPNSNYWDPQLSPYLEMETAIQGPAAFSEALDSSEYLFDLSEHFNQPESIQDDFLTGLSPTFDDSMMQLDQTDISLDTVDPAEPFDWDSVPEDWMLNANIKISSDAIAELNDLLSSMDDFPLKQHYEPSIEEITRYYLGELPELVFSPTTDESSESSEEL